MIETVMIVFAIGVFITFGAFLIAGIIFLYWIDK
jgi:hypothetical protein